MLASATETGLALGGDRQQTHGNAAAINVQ